MFITCFLNPFDPILEILFPSRKIIRKLFDMFKAKKKILVLGMPQSGKTTFHGIFKKNKVQASEYTATPNTKDVEECTIKYKDHAPIILGKSKDIPGDIDKQINALNKDVQTFFSNKNGLIIYIVNCVDLGKEAQIEHAARVLTIAFDAYQSAKVAIVYSHPDEIEEKSLKKIHDTFYMSLYNKGYTDTAHRVKVANHYLINLISDNALGKIVEIFDDTK